MFTTCKLFELSKYYHFSSIICLFYLKEKLKY